MCSTSGMSPTPKTRPVILLATVDDTDVAADVVRTAGLLAAALVNAELHLVRVVPPAFPIDGALSTVTFGPLMDELVMTAKDQLVDLAALATSHGARAPITHALVGVAGREIIELATKLDADVIVVGPHARSAVSRVLLGSVADYVARHASCSVLVSRPRPTAVAPEIEPPCPDCVAARSKTGDPTVWCERHSQHHVRANRHYETPATFGLGSTFFRPD
jgi:nucleotide-binding universal stress UspA family protein